jgi:hypothetical protein
MSSEDNKATLLRLLNELKKENLDIIDEVFSPTFTFHSTWAPAWPRGLKGARALNTLRQAVFPEKEATLDFVVVQDTMLKGVKDPPLLA